MEIINCIGYEKSSPVISLKETFTNFKFNEINFNPRCILFEGAKAFDFLALFAKRALVAVSIAAGLAVISTTAYFVHNHVCNFTGPLVLNNEDALDIESLNKRMQNFALEKADDYESDGTLTDAANTNIAKLFTQPVTYQTYKVQNGDTISGITKKFGLTNLSTLISINDIDNVRQLSSGQKLKIPSIDGLIYTVQKGNSLAGLSAKFNITMEDILDVNDLESANLYPGQQLFIPGAKMDSEQLKKALGVLFRSPISVKYRLTSYFGPRKDPFTGTPTNHKGIDMACPMGTPILASSGGKVIFTGYSNIYGNYVIIGHANGYQTLYGHMSKIIAKKGDLVSQGTRIGLVGSTGYSTGPHLHFSVYKNNQLVNPLTLIK